jgi:hypothetical protein
VIAHRLCRLIWKILHQGVRYEERGPALSQKSKRHRRAGVRESVAREITGHRTAAVFSRYDIKNQDDKRRALQARQAYETGLPATSSVTTLPVGSAWRAQCNLGHLSDTGGVSRAYRRRTKPPRPE